MYVWESICKHGLAQNLSPSQGSTNISYMNLSYCDKPVRALSLCIGISGSASGLVCVFLCVLGREAHVCPRGASCFQQSFWPYFYQGWFWLEGPKGLGPVPNILSELLESYPEILWQLLDWAMPPNPSGIAWKGH